MKKVMTLLIIISQLAAMAGAIVGFATEQWMQALCLIGWAILAELIQIGAKMPQPIELSVGIQEISEEECKEILDKIKAEKPKQI